MHIQKDLPVNAAKLVLQNSDIVDVTLIFNCSIIPTAGTSLQKYQKPYAGVVVFHLPCALEVGMNIDDTATFRVSVSFY